MSFDAGFVRAVVWELNSRILNARVDKIMMPEKEEIVLLLRAGRENLRLSLSCSSNAPRVNLTDEIKDNPASPPMFCMLLRKHLTGGRVTGVTQNGFERAIEIRFECHNEMGYADDRVLIAEIMGKCSNIIFCDGDKKIISAVRTVDFTTSSKRQILPGMKYDAPPSQNKSDPLCETRGGFLSKLSSFPPETPAADFICSSYEGISPLIARETVYRTSGDVSTPVCGIDGEALCSSFFGLMNDIKNNVFSPVLVKSGDKYAEYSFTAIKQYGKIGENVVCPSFGTLLDLYYVKKDRQNRVRQMTKELDKYLSNNVHRLRKKLRIFEEEDAKSRKELEYKRYGDAINAGIYLIKKGDRVAELTDYSSDTLEKLTVRLDEKLSPAMNAQYYYKRYNKAKTAVRMIAEQREKAENELKYVESVSDLLSRAENENDLDDIKRELEMSGYSVRIKDPKKKNAKKSEPMKFVTSGGYTVLCGRNNIQNEELTFRLSSKNDYWFHVKNAPGSHVIMICGGEEPPGADFTEAATIAATYSKESGGINVAVDYTLVKNVKKPKGTPFGFVTYSTNWTAYVDPSEEICEKLRKK